MASEKLGSEIRRIRKGDLVRKKLARKRAWEGRRFYGGACVRTQERYRRKVREDRAKFFLNPAANARSIAKRKSPSLAYHVADTAKQRFHPHIQNEGAIYYCRRQKSGAEAGATLTLCRSTVTCSRGALRTMANTCTVVRRRRSSSKPTSCRHMHISGFRGLSSHE